MCGFDETAAEPYGLPFRTLLAGRYVTGRIVGKPGGFGIVYLALDTESGERVAIKELYQPEVMARVGAGPTVRSVPGRREDFDWLLRRFLDEGRLLSRFRHPNIVRSRDCFEENGTAYLVMDYLEGRTLKEHLDSLEVGGERMPVPQSVEIVIRMLDALRAEIHAAGCVHRDIKPNNVHLTAGTLNPILLDFGSAREVVGERSQSAMYSDGYAAIEQYSRSRCSAATDVYGCAATLYRMLTRETPVAAPSRAQGEPLRPVRELRSDVSGELALVVEQGLALKAEDRPQTAREIQERLMHVPEGPEPLPPNPTPPRPRWSLYVAAGLVIVAFVIVAAVLRPNGESDGAAPAARPQPRAGEQAAWTIAGERFAFRWIPPGEIQIGSPDDEIGRHGDEERYTVRFTRGFWMQESEVTQRQWEAVREAVMDDPKLTHLPFWHQSHWAECTECPVDSVTRFHAEEFCAELARLTHGPYRLPNAAEWEYAARAGSPLPFGRTCSDYGEDTMFGLAKCLDQIAWYGGNSRGRTQEVCMAPVMPNVWGLCDMLGNVAEWVQDTYVAYDRYTINPVVDPKPVQGGSEGELRGGSWRDNPARLRAAHRYPGFGGLYSTFGFRCARDAE